MGSPLGFWLKQAGYSTAALAQAMCGGEPKSQMFHVKHFGGMNI
jgi:hypothetical protein